MVHNQRLAGQPFNGLQIRTLLDVAQRDRHARRPGDRSADPMDVRLRLVGKLEVQDMGNTFHVDSRAAMSVDQHLDTILFEIGQRALPGSLALVAVDRVGLDPRPLKLPGDPVGRVWFA